MRNLTDKPLDINSKQTITFIHLLSVDNIVGIAPCNFLRNLGLPDPAIYAAHYSLDAHPVSANHAEALAFLKENIDFFSAGRHDFSLMKGTSQLLELEDTRPFMVLALT